MAIAVIQKIILKFFISLEKFQFIITEPAQIYFVCLAITKAVLQTLFMKLFSWWPFSELFQLSGSVREWWFRCQLDRFAMFHGVIFCFIYLICKR